ncbi:MAG TPA: Ig-like domain-containing protein, partial [Pirellulaceae bacterium]|nr:Ig-like domain-containing protein [Pirellulaceae bacterium]
QNRIVFHPGFSAGGAFRIEGPGLGTLGNQNMGWVPALWTSGNNLLHHLTIHVSASGVFDIKLVDGANPNNFYSATFTNPGSVGGAISLLRAGGATDDAVFDNLRISNSVLDNDRDIDYNTALSVSQLNGSATLTGVSVKGATVVMQPDGRYTYDPNTSAILQTLAIGQSTTDTFTYTASNGVGGTTTGTVTITVTGGNDAPVVGNDSYSTTEDSLLTVPANAGNSLFSNDYDVDAGDTFTVSAYQAVSALGATVTVGANGALTYDPRNSVTLQALAANASVVDTFTYTIQDVHGAAATATVSVTVGGLNDTAQFTYVIAATQIGYEATPLSLNPLASVSDADGNETFTYSIAWGDGTPLSTGGATVTSAGATQPTLADIVSTHTYADNGLYTGSLTVTDSQGQEIVTPFTIRILNLGPTAIIEAAPTAGVPGLPLWFNFGATDPSPVDMAAGFTYVVNWGDGTPTQLISDPAELQHTFTTTGNYTVTVRARDKDNQLSPVLSTIVPITSAAVIDGTLYVGGTGQSDRIIVQSFTSIRMNVKILTLPSGANRVVVFGNDGNDTISVVSSSVPVSCFGGDGDDYLSGGQLDDMLDGGAGTDKLMGYAGRDVILGGPGDDSIFGGADNDYLSGNELLDPTVPTNLTPWAYVTAGYLLNDSDPGADYINGEAGNDLIFGGSGPDNLLGGLGDDYLRGGAAADKLDGGDGEDFLFGEADGDLLYGRNGDDVLVGGSGTDTLYGGNGSDLLLAGDLANVVVSDNAQLQALWMLWNAAPTASAAAVLLAHAVDDQVGDTIYGDADADWYLLFRTEKDKIQTSSELKAPNMFRYK